MYEHNPLFHVSQSKILANSIIIVVSENLGLATKEFSVFMIEIENSLFNLNMTPTNSKKFFFQYF